MRTPMRAHKRLDNLTQQALARAAGAASLGQGLISTDSAGVNPGDLTSGTNSAINLFAFDVTPQSTSGAYDLQAILVYTLSAADTVSLASLVLPNVTGFSGTQLGKLWYETAGHPLVVTAGSGQHGFFTNDQIATGQIAAQTKTLATTVQVFPTVGERQAILIQILALGGAHITNMTLWTSVREILR